MKKYLSSCMKCSNLDQVDAFNYILAMQWQKNKLLYQTKQLSRLMWAIIGHKSIRDTLCRSVGTPVQFDTEFVDFLSNVRIRPNYFIYSYKRTVKQSIVFRLQSVYFLSTSL